jgi:hypothetical protein
MGSETPGYSLRPLATCGDFQRLRRRCQDAKRAHNPRFLELLECAVFLAALIHAYVAVGLPSFRVFLTLVVLTHSRCTHGSV